MTPYGDMISKSTLVKVMAWCLMAPSHNLSQCWLIIKEACLHLSEGIFTETILEITHCKEYIWWKKHSQSRIQHYIKDHVNLATCERLMWYWYWIIVFKQFVLIWRSGGNCWICHQDDMIITSDMGTEHGIHPLAPGRYSSIFFKV